MSNTDHVTVTLFTYRSTHVPPTDSSMVYLVVGGNLIIL